MWTTQADVAKRARVGPRTQVHMTMEILFSNMFTSRKGLFIIIIVSDNILKLRLELIKIQMIMPRKSSIGFNGFQKLTFCVDIS